MSSCARRRALPPDRSTPRTANMTYRRRIRSNGTTPGRGTASGTTCATLSAEFYAGDPLAAGLPANTVPPALLPPDLREAYRALKGLPLRTEVYAVDGSAVAAEPYTVTEYRYEVRQIQPIDGNRHGVYFPFERERLRYHYERNPADPRVRPSAVARGRSAGTRGARRVRRLRAAQPARARTGAAHGHLRVEPVRGADRARVRLYPRRGHRERAV